MINGCANELEAGSDQIPSAVRAVSFCSRELLDRSPVTGRRSSPADAREKEMAGKQPNHRQRSGTRLVFRYPRARTETRGPNRFGLPSEYRGSDCPRRVPSNFDLDFAAATRSLGVRRTINARPKIRGTRNGPRSRRPINLLRWE